MHMDQLEKELKYHLKYDAFRPGQKAIIEDILIGHDVMGVLPTGSGKSLCYQLPAQLLKGITIVVSPLIALMTDQVKRLKASHYKGAIALNSFLPPYKRQKILNQLNRYKLIYISPELLQHDSVMNALKHHEISLFVIDEAHCISQWGHEFRPDYLKLSSTIESFGNPPVLALSATAPSQVQEDIMHALKRPGMHRHIHPVDRENIAFVVEKMTNKQHKVERLISLLKTCRVPTVVYFSSRQLTEDVALKLLSQLSGHRVAYYHGGMEQSERLLIQQQFMTDQVDVICCTSAFGMGIDKSNIRLVVHFHFPAELESYIQEVGRAGRDGLESVAVLLYDEEDVHLSRHLAAGGLPDEARLKGVFHLLKQLSTTNKTLPSDEEMAYMGRLNEIQWRFLKQQLIKHDIITGNHFIDRQINWDGAFKAIKTYIKHRLSIKEQKLRKMVDWMNSTGCLRENLYQHFQNDYTKKENNCCSNCGFEWGFRKSAENEKAGDEDKSWQCKLKTRLLQA